MKITSWAGHLSARPAASGTASSRAPSRPRWFGWPATCVPGPSRRPTRSSPPPAASASCRNRVGHIGNQLLPARLGSPHCPADVGRWRSGSQVRYQGGTVTYTAKDSELAAGGACASKRPSAGGNIGGRRRADLVAQDFDLYGWRCACCGLGGRGGGSAHREKLFGRNAETCGMYRWLRDNGLPEGSQILCLSCNESKGTGERCTLAYRQQEALLCL